MSTPLPSLVVMGVSGTGKSTVGLALSRRFGLGFVEGDDHHPPANIAKMAAGVPLDDDDRWPWLQQLSMILTTSHDAPVVLTCSALRRSYRDVLRADVAGAGVLFVHLAGSREVLLPRMSRRQRHFMPASLLESQLATLEPLEPDEQGVVVDVAGTVQDVVDAAEARVREALRPSG